jgi:outer membrane protein assembly factor BamB/serine/threonine protein kinase
MSSHDERGGQAVAVATPAAAHGPAAAAAARGDDRKNRPSAPSRPNLLKPGVVLQGRYRVQDVLGIGGMSTVYRGRDLHFAGVDRACAIKEMFNVGDDARMRQLRLTNFQREAALLAQLTHVAIPRIYDYFEHQGSIYLVLELIEGHDLETILGQRGEPFPEDQLITWSLELCDVLSYLHSWQPEPIIFRDLKPSNIMIRANGMLTLVDFGIARVFAPNEKGTMIGTEGYAPPEQYKGKADARGDIYAFGATLHHLATGSDPRGEIPFTFAQRPPRRLNSALTPEFEQLILKAVAYAPNDRFQSVEEVRETFQEIQKGRDRRVARVTATAASERTAAGGSQLLGRPPDIIASPRVQTAGIDRLAWQVITQDEVRGSASHAGGTVYVGSYDGNLYAIDETDGSVRWRFRCQRGVVSRPLPAADLVIFGSEDYSVYAVSRQLGRAVWSYRTTMPVRSSAQSDERACFIGSDDGFVYRIDRARGTVAWRYKSWGPVRGTPLIADKTVIFGSEDGYVYSVDRDTGQLVWRCHVGAGTVSSAALAGQTVVIGAADGAVRGLAVETGRVTWTHQTRKAIIASPVVVDQAAYVGSADGSVYALDASSGYQTWATPLCRQLTSTASIDGQQLYVGGTDGHLYCLNRADGTILWKFKAGGPIASRPLVTAEHVVFGSFDGKVYAVHRQT